jgi:hypothetical protein
MVIIEKLSFHKGGTVNLQQTEGERPAARLRTPEAVERKTAVLPSPPTDYTLLRGSVLNRCKLSVKDE